MPAGAKVLVVCDAGGSLEVVGTLQEGKRSRSLVACYRLLHAGMTGVTHVSGGMIRWAQQELPLEGDNLEKWVEDMGRKPI